MLSPFFSRFFLTYTKGITLKSLSMLITNVVGRPATFQRKLWKNKFITYFSKTRNFMADLGLPSVVTGWSSVGMQMEEENSLMGLEVRMGKTRISQAHCLPVILKHKSRNLKNKDGESNWLLFLVLWLAMYYSKEPSLKWMS